MPHFDLIPDEPVARPGHYIAPVAPDTRDQRVVATEFHDAAPLAMVTARNSGQAAWLFRLEAGARPRIRYRFEEAGGDWPHWAFRPAGTRFDAASPDLATEAAELAPGGAPAQRVPALMQAIADRFTYGKRARYLGDDQEAMPALGCDLNTGTCVDMHTLGVAALRALGIEAVYVIGGFVYADRAEFPTGHCWLNLRAAGAAHHYDISHHVEYGLGAVTPALNPKPGRRFALGLGRGLAFDGPEGTVEIPSLSGFYGLEGAARGVKLRSIGRFDG
jgi:transglutaminase-like putative cysteine protease